MTAAFSPDGRYIGVSTSESAVLIYRTGDLENEVARMELKEEAYTVVFSGDSRYVATAGFFPGFFSNGPKSEYPLRLWLLQPEDLIREATDRLSLLPRSAR